jgi:hypothetical protein
MTAGTKSAILLAVTLALGIIVGLAGAGSIDRLRRERLGGLARPMGFARHMEEVIRPRDAAQGDLVRPIIEHAAERNQRIIGDGNLALRQSVDSMKAELLPLLDETQRLRLDEATRGLPPFGPPGGPGGRGGRGGPRPFGPPPPPD